MVAVFLLSLFCSTLYALELRVTFPQGLPDKLDFAYGISTGDCSNPNPMQCHVNQAKLGGIRAAYINQYLNNINTLFKFLTPVADTLHKPANYIQMKVPGESELCDIDVLGKTKIVVNMNKNGSCIIS